MRDKCLNHVFFLTIVSLIHISSCFCKSVFILELYYGIKLVQGSMSTTIAECRLWAAHSVTDTYHRPGTILMLEEQYNKMCTREIVIKQTE